MNTQTQTRYYPTVKQSFNLIVRLFLISIAVAIPFLLIQYLLKKYVDLDKNIIESFINLMIYVIGSLIILRVAIKRFYSVNSNNYNLKFNRVPIGILLIVLITALATIFISDSLIDLIPMPVWYKNYLAEYMEHPDIFSFLSIVIAAPILEEIFFRGIILEGFLRNYPPQKAIIWSSIIFGLVHLDPWQGASAAIAGMIIGWIYWKTNSLVPGIIIHFSNNLLAFVAMSLYNNDLNFSNENVMEYWISILISLIIVVIGYNILNKKFKRLVIEPQETFNR